MSSPKDIMLSTVVPILGGIVAIVMYASPLKATYSARKQQQLGVRKDSGGGLSSDSSGALD